MATKKQKPQEVSDTSGRNCTNCRFYLAAEDRDNKEDYGECRRYPPVLMMIEEEPASIFPQVDAQAFCGEDGASQ